MVEKEGPPLVCNQQIFPLTRPGGPTLPTWSFDLLTAIMTVTLRRKSPNIYLRVETTTIMSLFHKGFQILIDP